MMFELNFGQTLKDSGAVEFGEFTLTNGIKSSYYIDIKKATTKPKILKVIVSRIVDYIKIYDIKADYIACIELGGVTIAVAVSLETDLPLIIVRKAEKEYGILDRIIGDFEKNKSVLFVEDVVTTGGSSINAIKLLKSQGLNVNYETCVVDREEGGKENLSKIGVNLIPIIKARELLKYNV